MEELGGVGTEDVNLKGREGRQKREVGKSVKLEYFILFFFFVTFSSLIKFPFLVMIYTM